MTPNNASAADGEWPMVSVVVPTVNRPDQLRRAVETILAQDYPGELECIIVFDGTEPAAPDLPVPARRQVRTLVNNRTKGLAGNRNTGYLDASGSYVATCDDDDEWRPAKIRTQVSLLRTRRDASLCATGIVIRNNDRDIERLAPSSDLTFAGLLRERHMEVHPSSFLFDRSVIERGLLVDEELPGGYGEDYEWLLRAARTGPVVCVPDPLTVVHWHDTSFFLSRWPTIEAALTYLLQAVPEFEQDPAGLARIEGQLAFANAAMGNRRRAVRLAGRSLRRSRRVRQSYAALLVACRLVNADRVVSMARRFGRGI
jgi:glycosyltransferase involved in cell wall biosynthesis